MARLKVFDTNALIAVSQGKHFLDSSKVRAAISIISKIEILSWAGLYETERRELRRILGSMDVIEIGTAVEEFTIDIRRNRLLKLPDAIIAATALSLRAPLVTNDQAFQRVVGLDLETI
jgi:predicted nucleic acid-binding protein